MPLKVNEWRNKQCGVTFFRSSNWFQNLLKKILREKINIDTEEKLSFLGFNKYSWRFGGAVSPQMEILGGETVKPIEVVSLGY